MPLLELVDLGIQSSLLGAAQQGGVDTTTRLIAIWGAAVATLVLALQLLRFRSERARAFVSAGIGTGMNGTSVTVKVANPPLAPPVTIMQAGLLGTEDSMLELVEEADGTPGDQSEITVRHMLIFHEDSPIRLQEGETRVFRIEIESLPPIVSKDGHEEFRAFAYDAEGRLIRGNKGKFFAHALESGWKPEPRREGDPFQTTSMIVAPDSRLQRLRWRRRYR